VVLSCFNYICLPESSSLISLTENENKVGDNCFFFLVSLNVEFTGTVPSEMDPVEIRFIR
jgi:hypothetical protein